MVDEIIKQGNKVTIVDAGNMLLNSPQAVELDKEKATAKAKLILEAQRKIGMHAGNVGYYDAALGIRFLEETMSDDPEKGYPWVSANLRDADGKTTDIPAYRIVEVAGVKLGIFGLIDDEQMPYSGLATKFGFLMDDPEKAARETVAALKAQNVDLIILLSGMNYFKSQALIDKVEGINFVINGGDARLMMEPERHTNTFLFAPLNRGKYLGVAYIGFVPGNPHFRLIGERMDIEKQLAVLETQKRMFQGEIAGDPEVKSAMATIAKDEEDLKARVANDSAGAGTIKNVLKPVEISIPDRPDVASILKPISGESGAPNNRNQH